MPNNTVSDGVDNTCTKSFWMGSVWYYFSFARILFC